MKDKDQIIESIQILKNKDDLDWKKYIDYKPVYKTEKNKTRHHEGYLMDRTFISQNVFFKLFDKSGN